LICEYWMVRNIFDCMIRMLLALAYPVYCMVVLYVILLSGDDHQFNWWEQMGEVSKEMEIPLLSHLGWTLCFCVSWVFFRATAHIFLCALLFYSLWLYLFIWFPLASWCAQLVGIVLRTPGLLYITILRDVSFNFA